MCWNKTHGTDNVVKGDMTLPQFDISYFVYIACSILSFIPAMVFHEVSHGFAAYKLGDPTAKAMGRLSVNPLKHIDIFGTIIMPAILMLFKMPIFGYAKPVPYNPTYFKDPRKGDLIVGLAGPAANFVQALIGAGIAWLCALFVPESVFSNIVFAYFYGMFLPVFVSVNLCFMMFNLLPIPPLDGSSIFAIFIPKKHLYKYYKIQQYALPIFMIIVIVLPYAINFNPIGLYINATAGNLANLLMP